MANIVLVHGLWLNPVSWDDWKQHFEQKGHQVLAPAWPGLEGSVEEVRQHTERYDRLGVKEITDHYDTIIRGLDSPPVIMGHSFGGLITQLLLDRGLGAAGVALSPAQIKGVLGLPYPQLKVASVALKNPANRHKAVGLTFDQWNYAFTNGFPEDEARRLYERYHVAAPGKPIFQAAMANLNPGAETRADTKNPQRGPLLIFTGEEDHAVPPAMSKAAFKKQKGHNPGVTEHIEMPNRGHSLTIDHGWREVAENALAFVKRFGD